MRNNRWSVLFPVAMTLAALGCGRDVVVGTSEGLSELTSQVVSEFDAAGTRVEVSVATNGAGSALRVLCTKYADVAAVDRPINADEAALCAYRGVHLVELPLAWDALVVVVNQNNSLGHMTQDTLATLWSWEQENQTTTWGDLRPDWASLPMRLHGPEARSDAYASLFSALFPDGDARVDYAHHDTDEDILQAVSADPLALGVVRFSSWQQSLAAVQVVAMDDERASNGLGAFMPTAHTLAAGSYQPLTQPWVLYVTTKALRRRPVRDFARSYVATAYARQASLPVVPLSYQAQHLVRLRLKRRLEGRLFDATPGGPLTSGLLEKRLEESLATSAPRAQLLFRR